MKSRARFLGPKKIRVLKKSNMTRTSKVGAISDAQKAQNIFGKKLEILFFRKMLHSAEKCKRETLFDL